MQNQFTEQSRRAVRYARIEAAENGSSVVEPEHLLLAILRDDHSKARILLREQGASPGAICEEVATLFYVRTPDQVAVTGTRSDQVALSPDAESILSTAAKTAAELGQSFVGPDHILIALLLEPTPLLASVWKKYNVSVTIPHASERPFQDVPTAQMLSHECEHVSIVSGDATQVWEKFTQAAKFAILSMQNEAVRSGLNEIPPPYLLSGVLQESETVVNDALTRCGVDRNALREALIDLLPTGPGFDPEQGAVLDPASKMAIDEARQFAKYLGDHHIGTEHLFLGLLANTAETGNLLRNNHLTTSGFLDALKKVKRGKRVERKYGVDSGLYNLVWLAILVVLVGWFWFSRGFP